MDLFETKVGVESKPSDETNKTFTPIKRHEFNTRLNNASNQFFSEARLEEINKDFETYWGLFNFINDSQWHPEEKRYTIFSSKQLAWIAWKVAIIYAQSGQDTLNKLLDLPKDFKVV